MASVTATPALGPSFGTAPAGKCTCRSVSLNSFSFTPSATDRERTNEYAASGPPAPFSNPGEMYPALAKTWAESSFQMNAVADAKGIRYFHFLQPNQYLQGSKPMGAEERRVAIKENHSYAISVRTGYPELRNRGRELIQRGVNFVDLTNLYASVREPVYADNCCHVNAAGRRIVVEAIAKTIISSLDGKK